MLCHGASVVCRCNCSKHHSCELLTNGIRNIRSWRCSEVLRNPGAKSHWNHDLSYDWSIHIFDPYFGAYPNGCTLRRVSVYGCVFAKRYEVLVQTIPLFDKLFPKEIRLLKAVPFQTIWIVCFCPEPYL